MLFFLHILFTDNNVASNDGGHIRGRSKYSTYQSNLRVGGAARLKSNSMMNLCGKDLDHIYKKNTHLYTLFFLFLFIKIYVLLLIR